MLITDGEPACCTRTGRVAHLYLLGACADGRAQDGVAMANSADAAGINIFTVSFGASVTQAVYTASLARGIGIVLQHARQHPARRASSPRSPGTIPIALVR